MRERPPNSTAGSGTAQPPPAACVRAPNLPCRLCGNPYRSRNDEAPLHALRILLADDHAVVRMGFRLPLEGAGAEVVGEADCGEAAVQAFRSAAPDVLLMDVSMPGIGGPRALRKRVLAHHPRRAC